MKKIYVIGIGPGGREHMTLKAIKALQECEVIVGYTPYIKFIEDLTEGKQVFTTGMTGELERCKAALDFAVEGRTTAVISTGDAGLYAMAGPVLEMADGVDVEIVPGVSSQYSAAAELGAPLMHDTATISLSDLLTPLELIYKRVELAVQGDFVISVYNPRSKGRPDYLDAALDIVRRYRSGSTPIGIVRNSGREDRTITVTNLDEIDTDIVDMSCMVIIGNSNTYVKDGKIITPRGYVIK